MTSGIRHLEIDSSFTQLPAKTNRWAARCRQAKPYVQRVDPGMTDAVRSTGRGDRGDGKVDWYKGGAEVMKVAVAPPPPPPMEGLGLQR